MEEVVLHHRQHDRRRTDLEERGDLAEVGVTDDDMEAPVPQWVGMGLVPGVDDRPLEGCLEPDLLLEEVCPLRQLEVDVAAAPSGELATDLARPREDLTGHEVGRGVGHDPPERRGPVDEVVLVAAVAVALAVRVVLVDDDLLSLGEDFVGGRHGLDEDQLGCPVEAHQFEGVEAFGRAELGVGVVHVVASSVREHGVDEVRLDFGSQGVERGESPKVEGGTLVDEVPADPRRAGAVAGHRASAQVGVDQQR